MNEWMDETIGASSHAFGSKQSVTSELTMQVSTLMLLQYKFEKGKIHLHFDVKQVIAAEQTRCVFSLKAPQICVSDQSYITKVVSFHVKNS